MKKWNDETTYSRDDTARTPRTWTIESSGIKVTVTRWRHGDPTRWYLICHEVGFASPSGLNHQDLEDAKKEALWKVHDVLTKRVEAIEALMEEK